MVKQRGFHWRGWLGTIALALSLIFWPSPPAWAAVHVYPEGPNQVVYRSQHSIRDDRDQAWQAIVFQRVQDGQPVDLHLRLVGFPGMGYPARRRPLELITGGEQRWELPSVSDREPNLTQNASQYDLAAFLRRESRNVPLKLYLPIRNSHPAILTVPPYLVAEWHQVATQAPADSRMDSIEVAFVSE